MEWQVRIFVEGRVECMHWWWGFDSTDFEEQEE